MESVFKPTSPDDIDMTLEITMPLRDWKSLRSRMSRSDHPEWKLDNAISDMVSKAERHFIPSAGD